MLLSPVPTLRRKKGTDQLAPVTCAHAEAEEGYRPACPCHLCPRCDGREAQEGVRRIGKSKDSDLCASAHRCPHYARLIARVTLKLAKPKIPPGKEYITKLSGRYSKERSMITAVGYFVSSAASASVSSVSS